MIKRKRKYILVNEQKSTNSLNHTCNHIWVKEEGAVYTSYPPKYKWTCSVCGEVTYRFCGEEPPFK